MLSWIAFLKWEHYIHKRHLGWIIFIFKISLWWAEMSSCTKLEVEVGESQAIGTWFLFCYFLTFIFDILSTTIWQLFKKHVILLNSANIPPMKDIKSLFAVIRFLFICNKNLSYRRYFASIFYCLYLKTSLFYSLVNNEK